MDNSTRELGEQWKSPRKVEEEIKQYIRDRFEFYMLMVDEGKLPRDIAISAISEEVSHIEEEANPAKD